LPFVFDALDVPQARRFTGPNPPQSLADAMHRAWGAFVTTGRPDHDQIPPWPRYTAARETVMEFGADVRPVPNGDADLLRLWSAPLTVERSG
jgi:para-nitrobenzyl esterase